jgi:hypothetical protein
LQQLVIRDIRRALQPLVGLLIAYPVQVLCWIARTRCMALAWGYE